MFAAEFATSAKALMQWLPRGQVISIRRPSETGQASILGHQFAVSDHWLRRLVRCEVDLNQNAIRFYGLRRSAPDQQPLLQEVAYELPAKALLE